MKLQEYVDTPVMLKFTKDHVNKTVTRSNIEPEEILGSLDTFRVGSIYVVLADSEQFEDGYLLVKCKSVNQASINGFYLEKCIGGRENQQFFKETSEVGKFANESIHTSLISVNLVDSVEKMYSVDSFELEEVLFSING